MDESQLAWSIPIMSNIELLLEIFQFFKTTTLRSYLHRRNIVHQILENDEFLSRDILLLRQHGIFQQKFSSQSRLDPLTWQRSIVVEICKLCWTTWHFVANPHHIMKQQFSTFVSGTVSFNSASTLIKSGAKIPHMGNKSVFNITICPLRAPGVENISSAQGRKRRKNEI